MAPEKSELLKRIESGESILIAETAPPKSGDPGPVRATAKRFAGKVHALGLSDNRDGVGMSSMAAAVLVASEGLEPIAHVVTRDRNRIALISDCLGAAALGVRNILCTSGTHQTLGAYRTARNVFDIDSIQLVRALDNLGTDAALVGEQSLDGVGSFCLGGVASPFADPMEMQVTRLAKKCEAGAKFLITQPVFDLERFETWWKAVSDRGLPGLTAIVAGIRVLTSGEEAKACAASRPSPLLPDETVERIASKSGAAAQRAEGVAIAVETIQRLQSLNGLRGFELRCEGDEDAALEAVDKSGLGT